MSPIEPTPEWDEACIAVVRQWRSNETEFNTAVKTLMQMLREAQSDKHVPNQARVHFTLGFMFSNYGEYDKALMWSQNALRLFEQLGNNGRIARCYLSMGEDYRLQRNFSKARLMYDNAYEYAEKANDDLNMLFARGNAGHIALAQQHYDTARDLLISTLERLKAYENASDEWALSTQEIRCEYQAALADAYLGLQDFDKSWHHATEVYALAKSLNRAFEEGLTNRVISQLLLAVGEVPDNHPDFVYDPDQYFNTAIEKFNMLDASGEVADTYFAYGMTLAQYGDVSSAMEKLQGASERYTRARMFDMAKKANTERLNLSRQGNV